MRFVCLWVLLIAQTYAYKEGTDWAVGNFCAMIFVFFASVFVSQHFNRQSMSSNQAGKQHEHSSDTL